MRAMKDSGVEWIGEIPEGWETVKLKHAVSLRLEKTTEKGIDLPYIGLEHVESFNGTLKSSLDVTDFDGDTLNYYDGDVLFGKLRPYLAKAYLANKAGRCSSEFWVLRSEKIGSKYLLYTVLSSYFIDNINHSTFGVKMPRAEWTYAGDQIMCCPDARSQSRIAGYLDAKCADIDALITGKEKTNTLLKEYRQSIIYEAVTKGLDPNVPMRDSGVEWIGEIPEGWECWKMKYLANKPLQYGANATGIEFTSDSPRYVRITDITADGRLSNEDKQSLPTDQAQPYILTEGDILFARSGATAGKSFFFTAEYGLCSFAGYLIRFSADSKKSIAKFLYYYTLTQAYEQWTQHIFVQATIQNISADKYNNLQFAIPASLDEQITIVEYLDAKCTEIDELIAANSTTIQKLKEYRQSLIYEAVTGKTEV